MKRLVIARVVLILGWVVLALSLPLTMYTGSISLWNPQQATPYSTWAMIWWLVNVPLGIFFLLPYFIGLVAGTLANIIPHRILSPRRIWLYRIGALGVCECLTLGIVDMISDILSPAMWNLPEGVGIGFFVCAFGSLLIGASAWIRPIEKINTN